MRKGKSDLTKAERLEIGILLRKGYSHRSIAKVLDRGKSTISYEVSENSTGGVYDPLKAHAKARVRKHYRRFEWTKIEENPALKKHIIQGLKEHWNPDEIAGEMKTNKYPFYASKTAIYEWLRSVRGQSYCKYLYSKRYKKKPRKKKTKKELIPNRVDISRRFRGATNRTRFRHFERDTIVGKKGTPGGLATGYERKAKLVLAFKVKSMRPREHVEVDKKMFSTVEALSVTRDNGLENRYHEQLAVPSFFCTPYSSWQKGGIENANKMLRRYFPKGTDFSKVSSEAVAHAVSIINHKPRKSLGYRSALEVALQAGIIKNNSVLTEG
jgi:transposase, IS30 family